MRDELIDRLLGLEPPTPAACFVLLWTYFRHDDVGLSRVENRVRQLWGHPFKLPGSSLSSKPDALRAAMEELRKLDGQEFDVLALRLLKGLDSLLNDGGELGEDFQDAELTGMGGKRYTVRSRNHFLAATWEGTWARRQGLSLAAYCRRFVAVPSDPVQGLLIQSRSRSSWGTSYLHQRLYEERERLRMMLWPFRCAFGYAALAEMARKPPPPHVHLRELGNEPELQAEVRAALAEARRQEATLLLLPELAIPPATEEEIRRELAGVGIDGYPILTLFGCSHRLNESGTQDINEAVLLGPDGQELHRHRKLAPFNDYADGDENPCGENVEPGTLVTVLECALGNLTPLICLDLLNETVQDLVNLSHANLLAVPSLSRKTSAHQDAADGYQVRILASTFVCNHWNEDPQSHKSTSFYKTPAKGRHQFHIQPGQNGPDLPYLLFELSPAPGGQSTI